MAAGDQGWAAAPRALHHLSPGGGAGLVPYHLPVLTALRKIVYPLAGRRRKNPAAVDQVQVSTPELEVKLLDEAGRPKGCLFGLTPKLMAVL